MSQHEWIDEYAAEHGLDAEQLELLREISRALVKHAVRFVVRRSLEEARAAGLLSGDDLQRMREEIER